MPSPTAVTPAPSPPPTRHWYLLTLPSFLLGSVIALFSQFVLQVTFYGFNSNFIQNLLHSTSSNETPLLMFKVVCFSISWSFVTCLIVFLGMVVSMHLLESVFVPPTSSTAPSPQSPRTCTTATKATMTDTRPDEEVEDDEDIPMLVTEIAYVFGAIVAIILLWTVFDFGLAIYPPITPSTIFTEPSDPYFAFLMRQSPLVVVLLANLITVLVLATTTAILHMIRYAYLKVTTAAARHADKIAASEDVEDALEDGDRSALIMTLSSSPSPTEWYIYCIASTVGLVVGMGTQMLLSMLLWNNADQIPFVVQSNVTIALFSLGWSTVTVVVTAMACYLLRVGVFRCIVQNYMHRNLSMHYRSLLIVRMEAIYIGWTLTGICGGWIILDIVHHMASQIYVSIVLFILSLSSFGGILYYFPEEIDEESETDSADVTLTEPLLTTDDANETA